MKHLNLKFSTWTDFAWFLTIAYCIFLITGFFVKFDCKIIIFDKEYTTTANLFTWIQTYNTNLSDWKLWVLLLSCLVITIILDYFLIKPLLYRTTKLYKIEKMETLKKYKELKSA